MNFEIIDNPNWLRGGLYALKLNGEIVLTDDSKEVLSVYAGLLIAEQSK